MTECLGQPNGHNYNTEPFCEITVFGKNSWEEIQGDPIRYALLNFKLTFDNKKLQILGQFEVENI